MAEIRAKVEPTAATDQALSAAAAALDQLLAHLNTGLVAVGGLDAERAAMAAQLDALEMVLASASPNAMARHLFGL